MYQAVKSSLFLYADDSCLIYQHGGIEEIEKQLNTDLENICHWFIDNAVSMHFGEDKTNCILFTIKEKIRRIRNLNVKYKDIKVTFKMKHFRGAYDLKTIEQNKLETKIFVS